MLTVPDLEDDVAGEHAHQLIIYLTNTSVVLWIRGGQIEIFFSIHEFVYWTVKVIFNNAILWSTKVEEVLCMNKVWEEKR